MESDDHHMVVNEFESLEADHEFPNGYEKVYFQQVSDKLDMYYTNIIYSFANEVRSELTQQTVN